MIHGIPRKNISEYLKYILSRKNLSFILYITIGVSIIFLLTLLSLFLLHNLKMIFFILLLMFLGTLTNTLNRFIPFSIGLELIMMGTILSSRVYSPVIGIMVGIISLTVSEFLIMRFKIGIAFSYLGIIVVSFLSHLFAGSDITYVGISLTIIYDAIILPGYFFTGSNPIKICIFAFTHIALNIWIFMKIAPFILRLMA